MQVRFENGEIFLVHSTHNRNLNDEPYVTQFLYVDWEFDAQKRILVLKSLTSPHILVVEVRSNYLDNPSRGWLYAWDESSMLDEFFSTRRFYQFADKKKPLTTSELKQLLG